MQLSSLPTARLSLEFRRSEFSAVQAGLRRAARRRRRTPSIVRSPGATHDILSIGGVRFLLMFDDGDPCLVSLNPVGDDYLRDVADMAAGVSRKTVGSRRARTAIAA